MATMAWLLVKIWVKPVAVGSPVPPARSAPQVMMLPSAFMAAKAEPLENKRVKPVPVGVPSAP